MSAVFELQMLWSRQSNKQDFICISRRSRRQVMSVLMNIALIRIPHLQINLEACSWMWIDPDVENKRTLQDHGVHYSAACASRSDREDEPRLQGQVLSQYW